MIETPRASDQSTYKEVVRADVISELRIFGYVLFGAGTTVEREVVWLVRTKDTDSNEGVVAAGFSVLDSVMLV
jgi:glutathione synthase